LTKTVAVIGAGLAGAACASAFAHAGWRVVVHERAAKPAASASGVPIALFAPSVSSDDAPHSRLLRSGVHLLVRELQRLTAVGLLRERVDWDMTGVLERCLRGHKTLPSTWLEPQDRIGLQSRVAGTADAVQELWHPMAGWVNPARLIAAWLAHPSITLKTQSRVLGLVDALALDADVVIVATGYQAPELLPSLKLSLQPIRGQVEWGRYGLGETSSPLNGMGHFIQANSAWLAGATFQRDEADLLPRQKDVDLNFEKLAKLMPMLGKPQLERLRSESESWVGVRTAQKNRQPLIQKMSEKISGNTSAEVRPNVWVCTGLGSRGLSLAALCASRLLASVQHCLALG
jgi:tRNA 5-methylaminomethyl-2-thiouridine biosynthesis bifunctional protein